jgi:GNAT superfamily N-acetyltransferase
LFSLRVIRPDDADLLPTFYYWTLYVQRSKSAPPVEILQQAPFLYYTQDWGREGDIGFLLENVANNQVIGMTWFRQFYSHHAGFGFINDQIPELTISIHPHYRGRGLGSQLLARLIQQARMEGFTGLSLSVHRHSPAIEFYQRHQFQPVNERDPLRVMQLLFA